MDLRNNENCLGGTLISDASKLDESGKQFFRSLFEKYDRDGSGTIDVKELITMIREDNEISERLVKRIVKYSDKNGDGKIDVDEFTNMLLDRRFKVVFGQYVTKYVNLVLPPDKRRKFKSVDSQAGTDTNLDGTYEEGLSCWPLPLCMITLSLVEFLCYFLNWSINDQSEKSTDYATDGMIAKVLIYDPYKRQECWRVFTYMLVHVSSIHLITNLIVQLLLGICLELRNQWWRVFIVYGAGGAAGCLLTSITDPNVYLAGASGGVYAIVTSHISNVIINWNEMTYGAPILFIITLIIIVDFGTAVHNRYFVADETPIGYAAHLGGAVAGFLVGIWVLTNVEPTQKEKYIWWSSLIIYMLMMGTMILLNIFWTSNFPPSSA